MRDLADRAVELVRERIDVATNHNFDGRGILLFSGGRDQAVMRGRNRSAKRGPRKRGPLFIFEIKLKYKYEKSYKRMFIRSKLQV